MGQEMCALALQIHGEKSSYQVLCEYYRDHLVMSIGHRNDLWIKDLSCCDYIRTSGIFRVPDMY